MTSHTPGPFMKFAMDASTCKGLVAVVRSPIGADISIVSTSDVASFEVEANASLFAASADMLAALKAAELELAEVVDCYSPDTIPDNKQWARSCMDALEKVRAAIAKAEAHP